MLQNIRAYLDYQPIDPLVNFLEVNPERIIRSYHFTSELSRLTARLIEGIAAPKTSEAARLITGPRGAGKSHTLAVVRALACTPKTRHLVSGNPPLANAVKRLEGTTFLPVYLSGAPLLNEVTDFPTLLRTALANIPDTPIAFDDTQWFSVLESQQVCELLASKLFPGMALLFVVDDISDVFRAPRRALVQETLDWLTKLAEKSRSLPFALLLALDSDVTAAHTGTAARLTADYQTDTLTLDNLRRITDQAVFRKTPSNGPNWRRSTRKPSRHFRAFTGAKKNFAASTRFTRPCWKSPPDFPPTAKVFPCSVSSTGSSAVPCGDGRRSSFHSMTCLTNTTLS